MVDLDEAAVQRGSSTPSVKRQRRGGEWGSGKGRAVWMSSERREGWNRWYKAEKMRVAKRSKWSCAEKKT